MQFPAWVALCIAGWVTVGGLLLYWMVRKWGAWEGWTGGIHDLRAPSWPFSVVVLFWPVPLVSLLIGVAIDRLGAKALADHKLDEERETAERLVAAREYPDLPVVPDNHAAAPDAPIRQSLIGPS